MRDAGFADVTSADGNVDDLAKLVAAHVKPPGAAPLSCRRGALRRSCRRAARARFRSDTALVYRAVAAETTAAPRRRGSSGRNRRRPAFLPPQRRSVCECGARRRPARKRVEAYSFLPVRPSCGTSRASRCRRHPHRAATGRGRPHQPYSFALRPPCFCRLPATAALPQRNPRRFAPRSRSRRRPFPRVNVVSTWS